MSHKFPPKENKIDYYWDLVMGAPNGQKAGVYLVQFYLFLFGLNKALPEDYKTIGKLLEVFGRNDVFVAILDYFRSTERNTYGTMYQALFSICRNRFIWGKNPNITSVGSYEPLDGYVEKQLKLSERIRKSSKKLPSSDGLL